MAVFLARIGPKKNFKNQKNRFLVEMDLVLSRISGNQEFMGIKNF